MSVFSPKQSSRNKTDDQASSGPIRYEGNLLAAPMEIHKETGRIVLSQKTRLWFRAAVCLWGTVVFLMPFIIYSELFSSETTRITCDRGAGECAVDGRTKDVPRLTGLKRAEMDRDYNRRDGVNYGINLVDSNGKKYSIEQQRAIKASVIADYRSAVKIINAFLADPNQQKLDISFTYRAGLWEIFQSFFYLMFGAGTLFVAALLWTRRTCTFESGKASIAVNRPFRHSRREIAGYQITALSTRQVLNRRLVELKLNDGSNLPIVDASQTDGPSVDQLVSDLAQLLGKRVEDAPATT
ncbi:MAG TPA: hypothetical protein VGL53_16955 [Bryobacteraceae bacterium]|jgi:hypothetical protein